MNNKTTHILPFLTALCITAASCTQTEVEEGRGGSYGNLPEVEALFHLHVLSSVEARTRSLTFTAHGTLETDTLVHVPSGDGGSPSTKAQAPLSEADETKLVSLWMGQYNAEGAQIATSYVAQLASQSDINLQLKRPQGKTRVYLIANAGDLTTATKGLPEAKLKELSRSNAFTSEGLPENNMCIMTGEWEGTITGAIEDPISFVRTMAKVQFTYSFDPAFTFAPTSLRLCNVPTGMRYAAPSADGQPDGMTYHTYDAAPAAGGTLYWYLPENRAGVVTSPPDSVAKTEKEKTGAGTRNATYIELMGNAVQAGVTYENVTFKLYPGNIREKDTGADNPMNNYNVSRNSSYNINLTLAGIDFSDKRVTLTTLPAMTLPDSLAAEKDSVTLLQTTFQPGKAWTFELPDWLSALIDGTPTASGTVSGEGPALIEFLARTSNPSASPRTGTFKIDTATVTISQKGAVVTCATDTLSAIAHTDTVASFVAPVGLDWSAALDGVPGWLSLIAPTSGTGNTTGKRQDVHLSTSVNPDNLMRTATITVRAGNAAGSEQPGPSATLTIRQDSSVFQIDSVLLNLDTMACSNSLQVTATPDLPWTLSKDPGGHDDITTTTTSGKGSQKVTFNATSNKDAARTAAFTFAVTGAEPERVRRVTVKQKNAGNIAKGYQVAPANTTAQMMNWAAAVSACRNLSADGFDDWSLPSKEVLSTIYAAKNSLGEAYTFLSRGYWSSMENGSAAFWVDFRNGAANSLVKTDNAFVRCVRVP